MFPCPHSSMAIVWQEATFLLWFQYNLIQEVPLGLPATQCSSWHHWSPSQIYHDSHELMYTPKVPQIKFLLYFIHTPAFHTPTFIKDLEIVKGCLKCLVSPIRISKFCSNGILNQQMLNQYDIHLIFSQCCEILVSMRTEFYFKLQTVVIVGVSLCVGFLYWGQILTSHCYWFIF